MMIHPPMLYTGYVGFSIPFAFAIGALITRRTGADWIRATRRFALIAWTFLGTGIMLGALWSYAELGWGGYWAWDPVENASLMPWLVGTAFLHSIMVQEKRGMLKVWNVSLICATFVLALIGTFLVRCGILDSIHAFGASTIGVQFLVFIGIVIAVSVALIVSRLPNLRSEAKLDSLLSREAFFLLNNLVLVGLCLVIIWGTFFPLISEAITGTEASVGPPWFDRLVTPLALVLVLLAGIGPVLAWRRVTPAALRRVLSVPLAVARGDARGCCSRSRTPPTARRRSRCSASSRSCWRWWARSCGAARRAPDDDRRAVAARAGAADRAQPAPLRRLPRARGHRGAVPRRGGVVGVRQQRDVRLRARADTFKVDGYEVTYRKATAGSAATARAPARRSRSARSSTCARTGKHFVMRPSRNYYPTTDPSLGAISRFFEGEATSEVDVRWGLRRDLWMAIRPDIGSLEGPIREADRKFANSPTDVQALIIAALAERYRHDPPPAAFRAIASPLVLWIWIGGGIVVLGALVAVWPSPEARLRRVRALYAARLGQELSRA